MFEKNTKWLTIVFAICFAILQALQPFIHAHLDTQNQNYGFHLGAQHEEAINTDHSNQDISITPHAPHTLSVDSGIKQDINPLMLLASLLAVLLSFCFALATQSSHRQNPALSLVLKECLKRRLPASRAPPRF